MAGEQIILDPTTEDAGNTQLDITSNAAGYWLMKHAYPTPEKDSVWSSSSDTEGERRANTRPKNRTITATVRCREAAGTPVIGTIVSKLQQKIAKLDSAGGTYKRVLPSGDVIIFDVLETTIDVPSDQDWATLKKADVTMTFVCRPHGRGTEVTSLSTHTATAKAPLVFTETGLKGDVPAVGRLMVTNATNPKSWLAWGVQVARYDSAASAALLLEAESCVATHGVLDPGPTGASGTGTNKAVKHASVGTSGSIASGDTLNLGSGGVQPVTHLGLFRVWARVWAVTANTGIVSIRLGYLTQAQPLVLNDWVPLASAAGSAIKNEWLVVDLGLISAPDPAYSGDAHSLWPTLYAKSTVAADTYYVDWFWLQPVTEGSGAANRLSTQSTDQVRIADRGVQWGSSAAGWSTPPDYQGDYLALPPALLEGRTLRVTVLFAGNTVTGNNEPVPVVHATNLDAITAKLFYTPRYLAVPEP